MPAYLVERKCQTCGQRSSCQVFDRWNGSAGFYCKKCGERKVRELNGDLDRRTRGSKPPA